MTPADTNQLPNRLRSQELTEAGDASAVAPSASPIKTATDIGRLIREDRKRRGLSQQAFADRVGVGRRFLSELENGKPTLEFDRVIEVAAACGIDLFAQRR